MSVDDGARLLATDPVEAYWQAANHAARLAARVERLERELNVAKASKAIVIHSRVCHLFADAEAAKAWPGYSDLDGLRFACVVESVEIHAGLTPATEGGGR
jgi:hypothetical protein